MMALTVVMVELPLFFVFSRKASAIEFAAGLLVSLILLVDTSMSYTGMSTQKKRFNKKVELFASAPWFPIAFLSGLFPGYSTLFLVTHIVKFPYVYSRIQAFSRGSLLPSWFKVAFIGLCSVTTINVLACLWHYIHHEDAGSALQFLDSIYWVVTTLTTIGYGDITPTTPLAKIYTMFVMVLGVLFYGVVIGQVSAQIMSSDARKRHIHEKLQSLAAFMKTYDIPYELQRNIYEVYHHRIQKNTADLDETILHDLPLALQHELQVYINTKPLSHVNFLKDCGMDCLMEVAKALIPADAAPGEVIIAQGNEAKELYIIDHGSVDVVIGDTKVAELGKGQCIGEGALIENRLRNASVIATDYCDLFLLEKDKLWPIVNKYPQIQQNIENILEQRRLATIANEKQRGKQSA